MKVSGRTALILSALSLAGGYAYAKATEPEKICIADSLTETVTVVKTVKAETTQEQHASEKIIERKIAVPCKCQQQKSCDKDINVPDKPSPDGILVMDERIIERSLGSSESLKFEGFSQDQLFTGRTKETPVKTNLDSHRWRVSVLGGYDWSDAVPVYGVSAGMRVLGPIEVGAWTTVNQRLHGAAGASVSVSW